jgi:hypothetical protein
VINLDRERLWIGLSARSHAVQLDVSPFPEVSAPSAATATSPSCTIGGAWGTRSATPAAPSTTPCAPAPGSRPSSGGCVSSPPGTWQQALAGALSISPDRQDDGPSYPAVEIAIYPGVIWLAARIFRARHQPSCGTVKRAKWP